jgi:hypothetical protein
MTLNPQRFDLVQGVLWSSIMLAGVYTGVDLRLGNGMLVPFVLCAISAPYFLLDRWGRWPAGGIWLATVPLVAAGAAMLAPPGPGIVGERLKGLVHLSYSIGIQYAFYQWLRERGRAWTCTLFGSIVVSLLIGCILENYTPLRVVSEVFRTEVFDERFLYRADARDLAFVGMIRPKLFTEEPSYVALFLLLALYVWFLLTQARWRLTAYLAATALGLWLIRSPVLLLALPLAGTAEIARRSDGNDGPRWHGAGVWRRTAVVVAGAAVVTAFVGRILFAERAEALLEGRDLSTTLRVVAPALLAGRVMELSPVVGIGITSEELLVHGAEGGYELVGLPQATIEKIINAFWLIPIYFGALGAAALGAVMTRFWRAVGLRDWWWAAVAVAVIWQTMGAFVGMRAWFALLIVTLAHTWANPAGVPDSVPDALPERMS